MFRIFDVMGAAAEPAVRRGHVSINSAIKNGQLLHLIPTPLSFRQCRWANEKVVQLPASAKIRCSFHHSLSKYEH